MTTAVQRRRGTTTEHSSFTGLEGEISVNTTKDTLVVHDGSTVGGFELARADGSNFVASTVDINGGTIDGTTIGSSSASTGAFTTLSATGEITANGGIALGDNDKATFGNGDDLQIYHDGTQNYIEDAGTGNLNFKSNGNNFNFLDGSDNVVMQIDIDSATTLYHNTSAKLATTATGIDVTDTVTADKLTLTNFAEIRSDTATLYLENAANTRYYSTKLSGTNPDLVTSYYDGAVVTERLRIDASGNVGIGTSSPLSKMSLEGGHISVGDLTGSAGTQEILSGYRERSGTTTYGNISIRSTYDIGSNASDMLFYTASGGTNTTERMRIDSSGNVKVGSSSIQIGYWEADAVHDGYLIPYNGSGQTELVNSFTTGALIFKTGTSKAERMRIDSSGNLLVGKTATAFNTNGVELRPNGAVWGTVTGQGAASFNIKGTDGVIADFYKDGATVGSIGTNSGLFIGSTYGNDSGIRFASSIIAPSTTTGANSDAAIDLGYDSSRFKDLYLSGGVYLGGTGAANHLDDYEEGTWTAALTADTGTITLSYDLMRYTKIGRVVTVSGLIICSAVSSPTGDLALTGLPFTVNNNTDGEYSGLSTGSIHIQGLASTITGNPQLDVVNNTTLIVIDGFNGTTRTQISTNISATTQIRICATYTV